MTHTFPASQRLVVLLNQLQATKEQQHYKQ
jgi:hypothetical protein